MTKRTKWATVVTGCWLLIGLVTICYRWHEASVMTMNNWGDALAGYFSPLAFMWLVVGYFQQGEELRLSADALRLQAEELRNSVEQQRRLVEVTQHDLELAKQSLDRERQEADSRLNPELRVHYLRMTADQNNRTFYIRVENIGYAASDINLESNAKAIRPMHIPVIAQDGSVEARFSTPPKDYQGIWLKFSCVDGKGAKRTYVSSLEELAPGQFRFSLPKEELS